MIRPKKKFLESYAGYLELLGLRMSPILWIALGSIIAAAAGFGFYVLAATQFGFDDPVIPFIIMFVIADLLMGYPYYKGNQRIADIERNFPDALKQMSEVLKSGGTYESALREVASGDYGFLTKEMQVVQRKLEEGENFENSLYSLSENIDSKTVQRTVTIIVDSVRAGAGLADILEDIADDIKESQRITDERKSRTVLQVLFITAAGVFVTPFIFGMISTIVSFLITTSINTGLATVEEKITISGAKEVILMMMEAYLLIEVFFSSLMIALMREGKMNKSVIYAPILLLIAYVIFFASKLITQGIIGGGTP